MTKNGRKFSWRIIGGILFLMLPILSSPNHSLDIWANLSNPEGLKDIFVYILYLTFFFAHYDYIIPKFFFQGRYISYAGLITLSLIIVVLVPGLIIQTGYRKTPPHFSFDPRLKRPEMGQYKPPPSENIEIFDKHNFDFHPPMPPSSGASNKKLSEWIKVGRYLPMFLVVLFVSLAIRINSRWREVEQEKTNAELSYLKAQVNPHFLFNTLNSIYALSIEKSDDTPHAITQLSNMMRYVLNDTNKDFVSLEKEINYISNYIELQKLRFGNTIKLRFSIVGKPNGKQIAPLILITFIENAFKHGVNPDDPSNIFIEIEMLNEQLVLTVENKKAPIRQGDYSLKSGLGIENARNRLQLLYATKHELTIAELETDYLICLKMKLT